MYHTPFIGLLNRYTPDYTVFTICAFYVFIMFVALSSHYTPDHIIVTVCFYYVFIMFVGLLNHYTPDQPDHTNCVMSLQKMEEVTSGFSNTMRSLVSTYRLNQIQFYTVLCISLHSMMCIFCPKVGSNAALVQFAFHVIHMFS